LSRAVTSYVRNFRKFERKLACLVCDDSSERAGQLTAKACEQLSRTLQFPIIFAGPNSKRALTKRFLIGGELPRDVVEFALFGGGYRGPRYGSNRNAVLLYTAGELVLSVDDDTECRPASPEAAHQSHPWFFRSDTDVTEFWFHPNRESTLGACEQRDVDVAARLESLGYHLREIGSLPLPDFADLLRIALWNQTSEYINSYETCLNEHKNAPTFWVNDMTHRIQRMRHDMTHPEFIIPADLVEHYPVDDALTVLQHLVRDYGQLMTYWPVMMDYAKRIASSGKERPLCFSD
jgi:hypothetical protein